MKLALAIFAKIPGGATPPKRRLANDIGRELTDRFYQQCIDQLWHEFAGLDRQLFDVYWCLHSEEGIGHPFWEDRPFDVILQKGSSLGERLANTYEQLIDGHSAVIFVGADCPHLDKEYLFQAIQGLEENDFVFGPSKDGGFCLVAGKVSIKKEVWTDAQYGTNSTLKDLTHLLTQNNFKVDVLTEALTDVDYGDDFKELFEEFKTRSKSSELLNRFSEFSQLQQSTPLPGQI